MRAPAASSRRRVAAASQARTGRSRGGCNRVREQTLLKIPWNTPGHRIWRYRRPLIWRCRRPRIWSCRRHRIWRCRRRQIRRCRILEPAKRAPPLPMDLPRDLCLCCSFIKSTCRHINRGGEAGVTQSLRIALSSLAVLDQVVS
jgi:hypothetical protein